MSTSTIGGNNDGLIDEILALDFSEGMESQRHLHIQSAKRSEYEGLNKFKLESAIVRKERDTLLMTVRLQ